MKYAVYKLMYKENVRWYVRPVGPNEPIDDPYVFEDWLLACKKAKELNEREGKPALAA